MTALDPTRPRPDGAPPEPPDELVEGGDPYECPSCVADRVECEFHRGWAAGWDACAAFMAQAVEDQRAAGLGGPLWVVCADGVCRHAEPFDGFVEADDFACSEHEGCGGAPHSIVTEPAGLGIATSESGDRPRGGTGGW